MTGAVPQSHGSWGAGRRNHPAGVLQPARHRLLQLPTPLRQGKAKDPFLYQKQQSRPKSYQIKGLQPPQPWGKVPANLLNTERGRPMTCSLAHWGGSKVGQASLGASQMTSAPLCHPAESGTAFQQLQGALTQSLTEHPEPTGYKVPPQCNSKFL